MPADKQLLQTRRDGGETPAEAEVNYRTIGAIGLIHNLPSKQHTTFFVFGSISIPYLSLLSPHAFLTSSPSRLSAAHSANEATIPSHIDLTISTFILTPPSHKKRLSAERVDAHVSTPSLVVRSSSVGRSLHTASLVLTSDLPSLTQSSIGRRHSFEHQSIFAYITPFWNSPTTTFLQDGCHSRALR